MDAAQLSPEQSLTFPATAAQHRFFFLEQAIPDFSGNNLAIQWELVGRFSNESVEAALRTVIARHEALRTRLIEIEGEVVQHVDDHVDFRMGLIEMRNLPRSEQSTRISQIVDELSKERFDLTQPCPFRVTLVRTANDRAMMIISVHHAVFDGYSIKVLGHEVGTLVEAYENGTRPDLPELTLQYGDYAKWQAACAEDSARAESGAYWTDALNEAEYFELPTDHPRAELGARNGARMNFPLPDAFGERLKSAASELGQSQFSLGTAAFATALHRLTGQTDISFATPVVGRDAAELEALIGVFINLTVMRVCLDTSATVSDALSEARQTVRNALRHSDHPFDDVVRRVGQRPDRLRTPLVSILFGLQKVFLEENTYGPVTINSIPSATPGITHDLSVQITGRKLGWGMMIDYDADRFDASTIERLSQTVLAAFEEVFENRDAPLASTSFLPKEGAEDLTKTSDVNLDAPERTETKARLAPLWSELLEIPEAQCDADFFDLGGHSLLALKLLSRVRTAFDVQPGISDFLRAPSLSGLAQTIDALAQTDTTRTKDAWDIIELSHGAQDAPLIVTINQPFLYQGLPSRTRAHVISLHLTEHAEISTAQSVDLLCQDAGASDFGTREGPALCLDGQLR